MKSLIDLMDDALAACYQESSYVMPPRSRVVVSYPNKNIVDVVLRLYNGLWARRAQYDPHFIVNYSTVLH